MKRIGKILDGRWQIKKCIREQRSYLLENIYNHETMTVKADTIKQIEEGNTTLSQVRSLRTYHSQKNQENDNRPFPYPPKAAIKQQMAIRKTAKK